MDTNQTHSKDNRASQHNYTSLGKAAIVTAMDAQAAERITIPSRILLELLCTGSFNKTIAASNVQEVDPT